MLDAMTSVSTEETIRNSLVPKKQQSLSSDEKKGMDLLQELEDKRKKILEEYSKKEADLLDQLKNLRAEANYFGQESNKLFPQLKQIKDVRNVVLTNGERDAALQNYSTSVELKTRFTEESYLMAVRNNKAQKKEKALYEPFRSALSSTKIITGLNQARDTAARKQAADKGENTPQPPNVDKDIFDIDG